MAIEIYEKLSDGHTLNQPLFDSTSTGVMLSTEWAQSGIADFAGNTTVTYNEYCPIANNATTHSVTGCTNTAAGQIIYYFIEKQNLDLTLTLEDSDAYTDRNKLKINADGSGKNTRDCDNDRERASVLKGREDKTDNGGRKHNSSRKSENYIAELM